MSFTEHPVKGVAILLWAADVAQPEKLATPFFHAAAAAAMEAQVELYFSAASVRGERCCLPASMEVKEA